LASVREGRTVFSLEELSPGVLKEGKAGGFRGEFGFSWGKFSGSGLCFERRKGNF